MLRNTSLTEKYRPKEISDIFGNEYVVKLFHNFSANGNMPNLILSGPPGTGKTSSILCLAKNLLGDDYRNCVMELNASDDRGIDIVRNKIKTFAQKSVSLPKNKHKIVILDESDSMTTCAQNALRRILEDYSHSTKFVFLCNHSSQIIEALHSRCCIIRYKPITSTAMFERLSYICEQEEVPYSSGGLEQIVFLTDGDMRKAVNTLQAVIGYAKNASDNEGIVNEENVNSICDPPPRDVIMSVITDVFKGEQGFISALQKMEQICDDGYSPIDVCIVFFKILKTESMDTQKKINCIKELSKCYNNLITKGNAKIQLCGLLANIVENF
jgi:replication factor C subunit 2/4